MGRIYPNSRPSRPMIAAVAGALLMAIALVAARPTFAQPPEDTPLPVTVPVEGLKSFGTSGKAVYPFTEGSTVSCNRSPHIANRTPRRRPFRRQPRFSGNRWEPNRMLTSQRQIRRRVPESGWSHW